MRKLSYRLRKNIYTRHIRRDKAVTFAILTTLIAGYFLTQFTGYCVHTLLHNPLLGRLKRSHETHHKKLYPPEDYLSDKYRSVPFRDSPILYYAPFALLIAAVAFWLLPPLFAALISVEVALIGWLNDYLHTVLHIRGHWLERFDWFLEWRKLHFIHHVDEEKNMGIFSFFSDMIFKTFVPVSSVHIPDELLVTNHLVLQSSEPPSQSVLPPENQTHSNEVQL